MSNDEGNNQDGVGCTAARVLIAVRGSHDAAVEAQHG